jgi:type IV pilus assembly protein PilB
VLQAILRQNPNVIMIGEILDEETADIALRAAQIGHLVLTTLRTNDSIDAITRLRSFGVAPNLLTSINGIVGQKLLRILCSCRKEVDATTEYRRSLKAMNFMEEVSRMYVHEGCSLCDNTGYRGRVAIFELLLADGAVREAIQTEKPADQIRKMLVDGGFRSMRQDALDKVLQGITTLEEVFRILPAINQLS